MKPLLTAITNQADKLKLRCVRRWVHLMPYEELAEVTEQKRMYKLMNEAYGELSKAMINTFYKHSAGNDLVPPDLNDNTNLSEESK